MQIVHHRYPVSKVDTKYIQEKKESHPKIFWSEISLQGGGRLAYPFYHCRWWTKCPIPMLLLHTFSMMGDYVVGAYNNDTRVLLQGGSKRHYPL